MSGDREVVYGRNPVRELLRAGRRPAFEVWALPQLAGEDWLAGAQVRERSRGEIGRAAGSADHQGVVAFAGPYPYAELADLVPAAGPLVAVDGAQDPRNLGAIARTAEAAGAAGLLIPRRGGATVSAVAAKASAGAVEHLPIATVGSVIAAVHEARDAGRLAVGTGLEGGQDLHEAELPPDPVLLLGAEGAGLRPKARAACNLVVTIPMRGHVASLNVSVAAGVLLFALPRT